jgi:hypothetical protein
MKERVWNMVSFLGANASDTKEAACAVSIPQLSQLSDSNSGGQRAYQLY